jgi:hypothetical protein
MGATRPNAYISGWSDPRGAYAADGLIGITRDEPKPGYNPAMKRKTCHKCSNLTWHNNGECTECG